MGFVVTKKTERDRIKRVTSISVAKEAGVSQATVSRVFNQKKDVFVSPEIIKKVKDAAHKLHYQPSVIARSLQTRSTNIIGIINRSFNSYFHSRSLELFTEKMQEAGYTTLLLNLPADGSMDSILPVALQYQVCGIIMTSVALESHLVEECRRYDTPVIQYNRYSNYQNVDSVCLDNFRAGQEVCEYLISLGHERIAIVSSIEKASTSLDRKKGFMTALEAHGMSLFEEFEMGSTYEAGERAADNFLKERELGDLPDAVFCTTDVVAIGFMDRARGTYGIRIPEDISIVGVDDIPEAAWDRYALTTISQPIEMLVDATVHVLFDAIQHGQIGVTRKTVPGELVKRNSVKDRRAGNA